MDSDRVRWLAGCVIEEEDTNGKTQKFLSDVTVEKLVKSGYTIHTFDGNNNNLVMKLDNFSIVALFVKHFPALQAFAEVENLHFFIASFNNSIIHTTFDTYCYINSKKCLSTIYA